MAHVGNGSGQAANSNAVAAFPGARSACRKMMTILSITRWVGYLQVGPWIFI